MLNVHSALEARYPVFFDRHRRTARTLSRFLGLLFYESRFQKFAEEYPHLEGFDFIDQVLRLAPSTAWPSSISYAMSAPT